MSEVFSLYIIALCSLAIALATFINLVLLVAVRRELSQRRRERGAVFAGLHRRVSNIEKFLVDTILAKQRAARAAREEGAHGQQTWQG